MQVEEQAPFCSHCGAPQIRVSAKPAADSSITHDPIPPPPPLPVLHGQEASFRAVLLGRIDWRAFSRITLRFAPVVGIFSLMVGPLAWLVLLPGSILLAMHLYRRGRPEPLTGLQGAKMGALTGLMSFAFFAIFLGTFATFAYGHYKQWVEALLARDPATAQQLAQSLPPGTNVVTLFTTSLVVLTLVALPAVGAITGALAATLIRDRSNP